METNEFSFQVYIISYSRYARGPITAKHFLDYKHIVRKSQEVAYIEHGFKNVVGVEDELISDYCYVFNYIVDNAPEDVIAIVDDDIAQFFYRTLKKTEIKSPEIVQSEFERLAQMIYDLNLGLAFCPPTTLERNYDAEFSWLGVPGAWKIVNRHAIKAKMDDEVPRNVDIDYVLQEVLKNRICLDAKYIVSKGYKDDTTTTTGSSYFKKDVEKSIDFMKLRWGKYFIYTRNGVPKLHVDR